jgi:hypothetical protein
MHSAFDCSNMYCFQRCMYGVNVIKYHPETSSLDEPFLVFDTSFALTLYVTCVTHFFTRRAAASVEATKIHVSAHSLENLRVFPKSQIKLSKQVVYKYDLRICSNSITRIFEDLKINKKKRMRIRT